MHAPSTLESRRLLFAVPERGDAAAIFTRYASDPEVTRYMGWSRHRTVADTEAFLAFAESEWARWPAGPYLIRTKSDGRLIGSTGLAFQRFDEAMTGYILAKDAWGRGFATEALTAMVSLAGQLALVRLFAPCHPENRASIHVLEKCGFTRDLHWSAPFEFPNMPVAGACPVACYERRFNR
ncbi:MAG: GNAT family N-acetyltransferase [Vicinamibacterales bacterium]